MSEYCQHGFDLGSECYKCLESHYHQARIKLTALEQQLAERDARIKELESWRSKDQSAIEEKDHKIVILEQKVKELQNALKQIAGFEIHMGSDYILWTKMRNIARLAITEESK